MLSYAVWSINNSLKSQFSTQIVSLKCALKWSAREELVNHVEFYEFLIRNWREAIKTHNNEWKITSNLDSTNYKNFFSSDIKCERASSTRHIIRYSPTLEWVMRSRERETCVNCQSVDPKRVPEFLGLSRENKNSCTKWEQESRRRKKIESETLRLRPHGTILCYSMLGFPSLLASITNQLTRKTRNHSMLRAQKISIVCDTMNLWVVEFFFWRVVQS